MDWAIYFPCSFELQLKEGPIILEGLLVLDFLGVHNLFWNISLCVNLNVNLNATPSMSWFFLADLLAMWWLCIFLQSLEPGVYPYKCHSSFQWPLEISFCTWFSNCCMSLSAPWPSSRIAKAKVKDAWAMVTVCEKSSLRHAFTFSQF